MNTMLDQSELAKTNESEDLMKKASIKPNDQVKWTHLEFARRIALNLVRYGYVSAEKCGDMFKMIASLIKKEELSLADMRALSAEFSRNATKRKRDSAAASLLSKLKKVKAQKRA
jgi:hypothetical protein